MPALSCVCGLAVRCGAGGCVVLVPARFFCFVFLKGVECRDCAAEFNAEFPMEGSNARSIYQGLLDALCND